MCGIFGLVSTSDIDLDRAVEALNSMEHRGPDQFNYLKTENAFVGHRRLSILDLSDAGKQPMSFGDVSITVNGEIYNYRELKNDLKNKYEFLSDSDSEVVLFGYIEWGIDELLSRIEGMYAISIFDYERKKVYIARDRVGIKPLYYFSNGNDFSWSSELKAIQKYYGETLSYDKTAFYDFLTYLYIPTPKTMYKNVHKVEPGHYISFNIDNRTVESKMYWDVSVSERNIDVLEAKNTLRKLIDRSVSEQLVSDVPVGFFLSGGVDSSVVVASASKSIHDMNTFTIGFDDPEHCESKFAEQIARLFDTNHSVQTLDSMQAKQLMSKLVEWYDEPFADTSAFPSYIVSKLARKKVTVVLTGDGGDEVFGGYNWYREYKKASGSLLRKVFSITQPLIDRVKPNIKNQLIRKIVTKFEREFTVTGFELYTKLMGGLIKNEKKDFASALGIPDSYDDYWHFRKYYRDDLPIYTRLQYLDFKTYLPDDILTKMDRVSMAVSLECRVPLLSTELIEFSFSLPEDVRYEHGNLKGLLKLAYSDSLPEQILHRKKRGFSIPMRFWKGTMFKNKRSKQEEILDLFSFDEVTKLN